jgi:L-lactate dehydrogenase (cytochrome)
MGETGVTRCLEIIHKELDITMALCGITDVRSADRSILVRDAVQRIARSREMEFEA